MLISGWPGTCHSPFRQSRLVLLAGLHLIALHSAGSSNPLGIDSRLDMIPLASAFGIKDLFGLIPGVGILLALTFLEPAMLMHPDN